MSSPPRTKILSARERLQQSIDAGLIVDDSFAPVHIDDVDAKTRAIAEKNRFFHICDALDYAEQETANNGERRMLLVHDGFLYLGDELDFDEDDTRITAGEPRFFYLADALDHLERKSKKSKKAKPAAPPADFVDVDTRPPEERGRLQNLADAWMLAESKGEGDKFFSPRQEEPHHSQKRGVPTTEDVSGPQASKKRRMGDA